MFEDVPFGLHRAKTYKAVLDRLTSRFSEAEWKEFMAAQAGAGREYSQKLARLALTRYFSAVAIGGARVSRSKRRLAQVEVTQLLAAPSEQGGTSPPMRLLKAGPIA